jgi:anion-transporting  ArsA/GET3 family ATPase
MDLGSQLATSRVVIVAGKGGVGKTTITAALAVAAAREGANVLIAEVEGKSGLAEAFGKPPLDYHEAELAPRIRARTITPDDALVEYLQDHGLGRFARRLAKTGALDVVATAVPGIRDILVLGKIKQLERSNTADLIIVDAPAAGHAITFLTSAAGLLNAARVGPIRQQAQEVVDMLADDERVSVVLVTLPEATPITECVETAYALEDRVGVALGPVIVNSCTPDARLLAGKWPVADAATTEQLLVEGTRAEVELDGAAALAEACTFHAGRVTRETAELARLNRLLPLAQLHLPKLAGPIGLEELTVLADRLTYERAT